MDIKKLIEKLPAEMRPFAQSYINSLASKTEEEIRALIQNIMRGEWEEAYKATLDGMSLEELKAEAERLKDNFKALNDAAKQRQAEQAAMVEMLLNIAFTAAKAYVGI